MDYPLSQAIVNLYLGKFTNGNPLLSIPRSLDRAEEMNAVYDEILNVITQGGLTPAENTNTQLATAIRNLINRGYLLLRDEKGNNVDGGASVAGLQTRTLNTVSFNTITGASLSANQFTLPAGTYRINASAPGFHCNGHTAFLRNFTDLTTPVIGTAENTLSVTATTVDPTQTRSHIMGKFTIASAKVFDIRHDISEASPAGLGKGGATVGALANIFTTVEIFKEA